MRKLHAHIRQLFSRQTLQSVTIRSKPTVRTSRRKSLNVEHLETRTLLAADIAAIGEIGNSNVEMANGTSALTRMDDMISIEANTSGLVAGDAVTSWWVIFNHPEFCEDACNGADLRNPAVEGALMFADGTVVDEDGKASFGADLREGDVSGVDIAHMDFPAAGTGLVNASKAEVHFVLRTHGAALPEGDSMRTEQLTTFNGGCNSECSNVQSATHNSPDSLVTSNPVHLFSDSAIDVAATDAKLTRYADTIAIQAATAELIPGDAVTLWWVVFNNPEFCAGSCAGSDLSNPAVGGSIMFADGAVVGEDGKATYRASLNEGDVSGVDAAHAGLPGAGIGLADASKAEVHIVMRTHGAALPEGDPMRTEQLTTFNGGCNSECSHVQAAAFNSPDSLVTSSPVHLFSDSAIDVAATDAKLTRYADTIAIQAATAELIPGDAVTLWWVVFNNPEFCAGSCAGSDLSNPAVGGSIMFADGAVVGEDGKATYRASLNEGDVSGVDAAHAGLPGAGIGLADASKAEVHIVMRTHGAALPEGDPMRTEQLTTFNGGCNSECSHVQAAAFNSPNPIILGDANGDGIFNSSDLVRVFEAGKYEDGIPNNATFGEGDWNQDGDFDSSDIIVAFQAGHYVAAAVPGADGVEAAIDFLFSQDDDLKQASRLVA